MPKSRPPYAAEFAGRWSSWSGRGARRRPWRGSSSRRPGHPELGGAGRPGCRRAHRRPAHREREEMRRLRRENRRLREEREILAKATAWFARGDRIRGIYRFMSANQARFRIAAMARVLGVSPSGVLCVASAGSIRPGRRLDADLTVRVSAIHAHSRGTYGAPRIQAELSAGGSAVSRKRVARVMRCGGHCGGEPAPRAAHDAAGGPGPAGPGSGRAPFRGGGAEPPVGRRHHVRPDAGRLPLCWPSSSTCSAGGSWVGRWQRTCARRW